MVIMAVMKFGITTKCLIKLDGQWLNEHDDQIEAVDPRSLAA
jgi:hypothetical protein